LPQAKAYHEKVALPLVQKLKDVIRGVLLRYFENIKELKTALDRANGQVQDLSKQVKKYESDLAPLKEIERNYRHLRRGLGENQADRIIHEVKIRVLAQQQTQSVKRDHMR